ncbi:MAG: methyl-accepting chemotaxis protein, partial [Spirochaetaceae bacterium]|nr:methyl-accepting chemotaxis protein [Spirochaetaceae bacterium]
MKIGIRLVLIISIINIIGIGLLAGLTIIESRQEIRRLVDEEAQTIALQQGEKIKNWFEAYLGLSRSLAQIMEGYQEIPPVERRGYFNLMLKQALIANPKITGVYATWSPNGLDGMDADYANTPGHDETGRFVPSWAVRNNEISVSPLASAAQDGWVAMSSNIDADYIYDPSVYTSRTYGDILITHMGSAIRENEKTIGLIGIGLELSTIQTMVSEIKPFGDGQAFLFSSGGLIAAHTDPARLGKDIRESEQDTFGPHLDTMVEAVTAGTPAAFSYHPPQSTSVIQYYAVPFTIGRSPQPWTLVVGVMRNTIMAPVYRMIRLSLIIGFLTIVLMSAGVIFTAHSISNPIAYTMNILKDIAQGNLTKEIAVLSKDELGELVGHLNFTVDKIKCLVLSIRKEADLLSQTGADLATNMTETAASINQINATIQSIKSQTTKQAISVKGATTSMGQIVAHIDRINTQIQKQTDCVSQSSSAVEQMLANIQSVTQTLVKNSGNVTKLAQASEVGSSGLQEVARDIKEIARESQG